jgi:hypothetical protein
MMCGSINGKLFFFNKLKNCTSNPGSVSCILRGDNFWCNPNGFESLVGRVKSKYWKRSISVVPDGKPLLQCLAHLGLNDLGRPAESLSQSLLQSLSPGLSVQLVISPVLF